MAYNPSPKVRKAEEVGKEFGFDKVIIIGIDEDAQEYETISWGKNKIECGIAKSIADYLSQRGS
ncbi:hypothetical protein [Fodinibius sp.]|uniref:hypothetical protein n=1 Tax=Fodinibius sp. TaxID=1872440 RepID=UPI002ACE3033|nr:hypothetical protein [Fodinibius sp.]MDZ7658047.1 hypothetical protein [Fodinibius sp.]